jgi:acetyl esterase
MALDPQAREFLDRLAAANLPRIETLPVDQARVQLELSTRFLGPLPRVAGVNDRAIPGPGGPLRVRIIQPATAAAARPPVLVYFHGGGWVLGSIETHEGMCRAIANEGGVVVVSVDYRRAPEHPFPAAVEDAHAAFAWVLDQADELGADRSRVAVGGDSAGGNLAAAACLLARDRGGPVPRLQILLYPITEYDLETPSYREFAEGFFLTRSEMAWYWEQYVPDRELRGHPYASPCRGELAGLPPAIVVTAECDVLRDEGEAFAHRLQEAGVTTRLLRFPGMIHGFIRRHAFFDQGKAAIEVVARELRRIGEEVG